MHINIYINQDVVTCFANNGACVKSRNSLARQVTVAEEVSADIAAETDGF